MFFCLSFLERSYQKQWRVVVGTTAKTSLAVFIWKPSLLLPDVSKQELGLALAGFIGASRFVRLEESDKVSFFIYKEQNVIGSKYSN